MNVRRRVRRIVAPARCKAVRPDGSCCTRPVMDPGARCTPCLHVLADGPIDYAAVAAHEPGLTAVEIDALLGHASDLVQLALAHSDERLPRSAIQTLLAHRSVPVRTTAAGRPDVTLADATAAYERWGSGDPVVAALELNTELRRQHRIAVA